MVFNLDLIKISPFVPRTFDCSLCNFDITLNFCGTNATIHNFQKRKIILTQCTCTHANWCIVPSQITNIIKKSADTRKNASQLMQFQRSRRLSSSGKILPRKNSMSSGKILPQKSNFPCENATVTGYIMVRSSRKCDDSVSFIPICTSKYNGFFINNYYS